MTHSSPRLHKPSTDLAPATPQGHEGSQEHPNRRNWMRGAGLFSAGAALGALTSPYTAGVRNALSLYDVGFDFKVNLFAEGLVPNRLTEGERRALSDLPASHGNIKGFISAFLKVPSELAGELTIERGDESITSRAPISGGNIWLPLKYAHWRGQERFTLTFFSDSLVNGIASKEFKVPTALSAQELGELIHPDSVGTGSSDLARVRYIETNPSRYHECEVTVGESSVSYVISGVENLFGLTTDQYRRFLSVTARERISLKQYQSIVSSLSTDNG